MRFTTVLVALLAAGATAACSSGGSPESDPYCRRLVAINDRLASAEEDLFTNGARDEDALPRIVQELQDARAGAPADVRAALAELVTAFQRTEQALREPTKQAQQQLAEAAHVLSVDGKKISDYVTSKCS